jgi:adenylate cyclase
MSVGDSLLDYLSKDQIISEIKRTRYMYTRLTDEFGQVYMRDGLSKYHFVSFFVRAKDKNFIIHGITGTMSHVEDISECHKQMNEIANEFSTLFKEAEKEENSYDHGVDKTGRSKIKEIYFILKSENYVRIVCMDFEESLRIKNNWIDGLDITLLTKELADWFENPIN